MVYDVVIVGGGTAGLAALATAQEFDLSVCLVEKTDRLGGQLHISSAQFSAAGTARQRERGIVDHPELHFQDILSLGHGLGSRDLIRQAVYAAPLTVDWLASKGFPFHPDCPVPALGHEAYSAPRVYWGGSGGSEGGAILLETLLGAIDLESDALELLTSTSLNRLVAVNTSEGTVITGVEVTLPSGESQVLEAPWTILATGGYAASRELIAELHPEYANSLSASLRHATGDGLRALMLEGVHPTLADTYCPTVGLISDPDAPGFSRNMFEMMAITNSKRRVPYEVWVNKAGRRFIREDSDSPFEVEEALRGQLDQTMFIVFDYETLVNAPSLFGPAWHAADIDSMSNVGGPITKANSIESLAALIGAPAGALRETIDVYNSSFSGADPLGREVFPRPITGSPFYAVEVVGGMLVSRAGPAVDEDFQPIDAAGQPLAGCMAVGELLGMGQISGDSFAGGMSVGAALSFGRLAVAKIVAKRIAA